MGQRVSGISLIIYILINTVIVINCDIHEMRQQHIDRLVAASSESISVNEIDVKINATELQEHIMSGLNMTNKPDIDLVSFSPEKC